MRDHSKQLVCSECMSAVGKAGHKEHTEQEEETKANTEEQESE